MRNHLKKVFLVVSLAGFGAMACSSSSPTPNPGTAGTSGGGKGGGAAGCRLVVRRAAARRVRAAARRARAAARRAPVAARRARRRCGGSGGAGGGTADTAALGRSGVNAGDHQRSGGDGVTAVRRTGAGVHADDLSVVVSSQFTAVPLRLGEGRPDFSSRDDR